MEAQDAAIRDLAPQLVGGTAAQAQALAEQAAARTGLDLTIRLVESGHMIPLVGVFGGITAWLRDGIVVSTDRT